MSSVETDKPVDIQPESASLPEQVAALDLKDEKATDPTPSAPIEPEKTVTGEKSEDMEPKAVAAPTGPVLEPFTDPLPSCKPAPSSPITEEQEKKYEELLTIVKNWTKVPKTEAANAPEDDINDNDRLWLTRDCLIRYLNAVKWDVPTAAKRLLATLTWRREYGLLEFTHDYISPENETGKQVILGYDNEGRPCLYLNPSKQNTERSDRQLQHLFYNMERVIELMPPGQSHLALLINFMDTKRGQGASIQQGRQTLYVLQNHYPERLGRALITDLPWYISGFFKLITPFIDPVTRPKLKFNEPIQNYVPPEQLLIPFGGKVDFEYKHDIYWPALDKLCTQRRKEYQGRWVKAGKAIGEHETYLRGGDHSSLNGEHKGTDFKVGAGETWMNE